MLDAVVIAARPPAPALEQVISPAALVFIADLVRRFRARVAELRTAMVGGAPHDLRWMDEPTYISWPGFTERPDGWTCAPPPPALAGRRVELVGPMDGRSALIAMSAGADALVADLDDSTAPTWVNVLEAQSRLKTIIAQLRRVEAGGRVALPPVLLQPRPLRVDEDCVLIDQRAVPAALFDVGLYCFHNAHTLADRDEGPFFSLSKINDSLEARLWNDVFAYVEDALALRSGTIKASARIDTVRALDEADEILWELRSRSLGLVCERSEYVRDLIASQAGDLSAGAVTPDRRLITVDRPPLASAARRLVDVCRLRGVHAIGPTSHELSRVGAAATRHARMGFHGTRVTSSESVAIARAAFAVASEESRGVYHPAARDDCPFPPTEHSVRENVRIVLGHLEASLAGQARMYRDTFVEDRGTARVARAQLWEWLQRRLDLKAGVTLDRTRFRRIVREEAERMGAEPRIHIAFEQLCLAETFREFEDCEERLRRQQLA